MSASPDEPTDPNDLTPDPYGIPPQKIIKYQKYWALLAAIAGWAGALILFFERPVSFLQDPQLAVVAAILWLLALNWLAWKLYPYTVDQVIRGIARDE